MHRNDFVRCGGLFAGLLAVSIVVQADPLSNDDAIKLRRAAFALQGQYFSQLKPMANASEPFDAARAAQLVVRVTALSQMAAEFFPAGSDQGNTKARAEIWQEPDAFAMKQKALQTELEGLASAVVAADAGIFKSRVASTSAACKACHEKYRAR